MIILYMQAFPAGSYADGDHIPIPNTQILVSLIRSLRENGNKARKKDPVSHLIVPLNNFCASGNNTSVRTTRAIALAPYTSEYPLSANQFLASSLTSILTLLSLASLSATSLNLRSTTSKIAGRESLLKTVRLSRRLMSSGGKRAETEARTAECAEGEMDPSGRVEFGSARMSEPRLLVRQMMVFCVDKGKIRRCV